MENLKFLCCCYSKTKCILKSDMGELVIFLHQDPANFMQTSPQVSPCKCIHMMVVGFRFFLLSSKHCDHDTVINDGRSVKIICHLPHSCGKYINNPGTNKLMENQIHFLHQKVFSLTMKVQTHYLLVGLKRTMEISVRTTSVLSLDSRTSTIIQNRRINNYTVIFTLTRFINLIQHTFLSSNLSATPKMSHKM